MSTNDTNYHNSYHLNLPNARNFVWSGYQKLALQNLFPFQVSVPPPSSEIPTSPSSSMRMNNAYRNTRLPDYFNSFSNFFASAGETFLGKFIIAPLSALGLRMQKQGKGLLMVAKEISASGKPLHLLTGTSSLFRRDLLFLPVSIPAVEAMRDSMVDPSNNDVAKIAKSPIFDADANGILSYAWNYFKPICSITNSPIKTIFQTIRQYGFSGFSKSMGHTPGRIAVAQGLFSGLISSVEHLVNHIHASKQKK